MQMEPQYNLWVGTLKSAEIATEKVMRVVLFQVTRMGPRETKFVKAEVVPDNKTDHNQPTADVTGVISPNETVLANVSCDFVEQLWNGESNVSIELNNWSTGPQKLDKDQE